MAGVGGIAARALGAETLVLTPPSALRRQIEIALHPPRLSYSFPEGFPLLDGIEARLSGRPLVVGVEVFFDVAERRVLLDTPFQDGDTLTVVYRTLPIALATAYGAAPAWAPPDSSADATARYAALALPALPAAIPVAPPATLSAGVPGEPVAASGGPRLDITGSKSLVVETGNRQDATLRQSLDVSASGSLGGGAELTAVLSDRDAPIAGGGGTLDLDEIDRILVEVRHEHGTARLGDYALRQDLGRYGRFERLGSGAQLEGRFAGAEVTGSLAQSKGRFHSLRLTGQEGRQGPYPLTDESGAAPVAVVSGSETVWLDGVRLARGESADYSLDYGRGTLTFTPRRPIAAGARITIDYQIASTPYTRLATRGAAIWAQGGWRLFGHAFREVDDAARPASAPLTEAERERLASAGDTADSALALPRDHVLLGGGASWSWGSVLRLEGEGASSRYDRNRLSSLDDDDNEGASWRLGAALTPRLRWGDTPLGALEVTAAEERMDPRFLPVGRLESPLFAEDWGLGLGRSVAGRDTRLLTLGYRPVARLRLGGERAALASADGFSSDRWRWSGEWAGDFAHRLRVERVRTSDTAAAARARPEGYRDVLAYETSWKLWPALVPSFQWLTDELVPPGTDPAERRRGWESGLSGERGRWAWSGGFGRRRVWDLGEAGWFEESRSQEWRGDVRAHLGRDASAGVAASRRVTEFPSGSRTTSDNGTARLAFGVFRARHEAALEWSAEGAPLRLPVLEFVGSGAGAYDSLGAASPGGGYTLAYRESLGTLVRLSRGRLAYRAEWVFGGGREGGGWRLLTTAQSSAAGRGDLAPRLFLATPSALARHSEIVSGTFLFRQELSSPAARAVAWALRLERLGQAERQTVGYEDSHASWTEELRLRWRPARAWTWDARLGGAQREGLTRTPGEAGSRRLDEWGLEGSLTHAPGERLSIAARAEWISLSPAGDPVLQALRFGPRLTWAIGPRARLEGETLWSPGSTARAWPAVAASATRSPWERVFHRLDLSYRLRAHGHLGFEWLARALPGEAVVHTVRGELRAYF